MSQLLEATTRERDEYQAQVHLLTSRVEELESSLQEQTEKAGKKQESEQEYKALYLQAQGEMEQFRHELEKLKREKAQAGVVNKGEGQEGGAGEGAQSDGGTAVPDVDDELACQVDFLMRELDQRTKQKEEYCLNITLTSHLRELRQNVTHLLINFVPALDLQQVNFDCDVIDEILAQVLDLISSPLAAGQSS
uniref:Uncharacterized protein n=1 Tax=Electrophorus electricus TaxID=8005 RepID=A0AAY5EC91_ELEEL